MILDAFFEYSSHIILLFRTSSESSDLEAESDFEKVEEKNRNESEVVPDMNPSAEDELIARFFYFPYSGFI